MLRNLGLKIILCYLPKFSYLWRGKKKIAPFVVYNS